MGSTFFLVVAWVNVRIDGTAALAGYLPSTCATRVLLTDGILRLARTVGNVAEQCRAALRFDSLLAWRSNES